MRKNTASQKWVVFAFGGQGHTTPGDPVTGDAANITANIRIDGGAANAVDDTNPTELEDGYYVFDVTAAETNGNLLTIAPASSTSDVLVVGVPGSVWTTPANIWEVYETDWSTAYDTTGNRWHVVDATVAANLAIVFDTQFSSAFNTDWAGWRSPHSLIGTCTSATTTSITAAEFGTSSNAASYVGGTIVIGTDSATAPHAIGKVTAFTPATDTVTVTGLYAAPSNGDDFLFLFPMGG